MNRLKDYIENRIKKINEDEKETKCYGCDDIDSCRNQCGCYDEREGMDFSAEDVVQELQWILEKIPTP